MGDLLFHLNPMRGRSAVEARQPFERVVALEPDHVGAMVHLARIAAIEGRRDDDAGPDRHASCARAPTATRRCRCGRFAPTRRATQAGMEAVARELGSGAGDHRRDRLRRRRRCMPAISTGRRRWRGSSSRWRDRPSCARSATSSWRTSPLARASGELGADELAARRAARPGLGAGDSADCWPRLPVRRAGLRRSSRRCARDSSAWDAADAPPSSFPIFAMHNDLHPTIRDYLLGMHRRCGWTISTPRARHAEELTRHGDGRRWPRRIAWPRSWTPTVARADGRTGEALAMLERSRPRLWFQLTVASPFFSPRLAALSPGRAAAGDRAGGGSGGVVRSIAQRSPYELVYSKAAAERLGEMKTR